MTSRPLFDIAINRRKVRLGERTLIMGVLNVTPDSFSDGGLYFDPKHAVEHALEMARQGADWIDIGGESTRPGSKPVPPEEELRRVLPVIKALHRKLPSLPISIDTTKAGVAEAGIRAGASILNDVSGLRFERRLAEVARRHGTPLVLMHLRGRPESMQTRPFVKSIWRSLRDGLEWSIRAALDAGVYRSQLIIDPGLGFGKTRRQNFEIVAQLDRLRSFHLPILVGTSRKSFVQAIVAGEGLAPDRVAPGSSPARAAVGRGSEASAALKGGATRPRDSSKDGDSASLWALSAKSRAGSARASDCEAVPQLLLGDAAMVAAAILAGAHIVRVHDVNSVMPAVRIADAVLEAGSGRLLQQLIAQK